MSEWFTEEEKGKVRFGLKCKQQLFHQKSPYQDVKVVETVAYGKMLTLDDCVMVTDGDEFVYHEVIAHIPACFHKAPRKVVVIGGGDGGTVRELLKHAEIEEIVLCEIDAMVVEASRQFFPKVACGLDDPRVTVKIGDGIAYMQALKHEADIIIVDSADPIGPGIGLFTTDFYRSVAAALKPGGIMVAQSESPWHDAAMLRKIYDNMKAGFPNLRPYVASIPTYPRGLWSWTLASQSDLNDENFNRERFAKVAADLDYLTEAGVKAAFALPAFYARKLGVSANGQTH